MLLAAAAPTVMITEQHRHRIVVFSHSAQLRGAERALLAITRRLVADSHEVVVVVRRRGPLIARLQELGASVHVHPMPPWLARKSAWPVFIGRAIIALVCLPRLAWLVRKTKPCVAYTNSLVTPEGAIAARLTGVPHIWHIREYVPGNETLRGHLSLRRIMRTTARLSKARIAVSTTVAEQCTGDGGPDPVVVAAGMDPERFATERPTRDEWLAAGAPAVAVVGSVSAAKGTDLAVGVLHELRRTHPGARLLIAGAGEPRFVEAVRQAIAAGGDDDAVRIVDFVDDVRSVYDAADAVLVTSRHEAYGLVTLEALSAGAPVVGSASGSTRDLLSGCGLLADPGNAVQFAAHVAAIADDAALRAWLVARGQQFVAGLDPDAEAVALLAAAAQVCSGG
ncbi:MAG TPA: glycosyltransferase family 4 protein [Mycobacteriales bacterium]|nr:glycosyltransferase family 4 protein [Mycobacteriales bacterium]